MPDPLSLTSEHLFDSVAPPFGPSGRKDLVLAEQIRTALDPHVALSEVTFCVVDLETTGGSPVDSRITEIGAVKVCGGERIGTFQTLVDPREPIPPYVAGLTGIDDRLIAGEPPIEQVVPALVEFLRGSVFVAHNASFDFAFVNAALSRLDYDQVPGPPVCTAKLARRVVWPDVPDVKLATLARYFRTRVQPVHRALPDAEATAEVLHGLIDLGGRLGILTLGELQEACRARGRPNYGKIRLADHLPRGPGVYLFRGRGGRVLYVGKSKDVRTRVKSYFYGDPRKQIDALLTEVAAVEAVRCDSELEALVVEARMIAAHEPPYNRRGKTWRRFAYLKVDPAEAFPRIKVVRVARDDGATYLGPFGGSARARLAKEALEEVLPIRRCTAAMGARTRFAPCVLADIGRCAAPCDGRVDPERYGELVRTLLSSLQRPGGLLAALETRMSSLAHQERFEEAGLVRDRLRALAEALRRARQDAWLVRAGVMVLATPRDARVRLRGACLAGDDALGPIALPCPPERADELSAVRSWIAAQRDLRVEHVDVPPAEHVDGGREIARVLGSTRRAAARSR
jgi:DNA polymerase III subunit epsilon